MAHLGSLFVDGGIHPGDFVFYGVGDPTLPSLVSLVENVNLRAALLASMPM